MTANEPAEVAILGSCVSRDLLRISMKGEAQCPLYVARQSFLSFGKPVTDNKPTEPEFPAQFQLASYRSDINGSGLKRVLKVSKDIDLLLIDIVDERHGVYISPLGEVLTRSIDSMATGIYDTLSDWKQLSFGTPEHLQAFKNRAALVKQTLVEANLFDRTVAILAPWATHMTTGEKTPLSMGKSAEWANSVLTDYEQVFKDLEFTVVNPDPDTIIGDPEHQWGPAPFHYVQAFYDSLAEQIRPYLKGANKNQ